jgi:anti-sigma regulatory factor (Ser/Thr protein kinase)
VQFKPDLRIETTRNPTTQNVALAGELDGRSPAPIEELRRAAREREFTTLVLDMHALSDTDPASSQPASSRPATSPEPTERIAVDLERDLSAPARARAAIRSATAPLGEDAACVLTLLVSELVTNAVIHPASRAGDRIGLRIEVGAHGVRVEVSDAGGGFDPDHPEPRPPERGGRGLLLVDRLSSRWGAGRTGAGVRFRVWFELDCEVRESLAT